MPEDTPTADAPAADAATTPAPAATTTTTATTTPAPAAEETISLDEARKLRQEAKSLRDRLRGFEQADTERQRAAMTETDRLRAEADDAKAQLAERDTALAAERAATAVRDAASELGYSPKLAAALTAGRTFELGTDGRPQQHAVREALKALAREYPELALSAGAGATNHARTGAPPFDNKALRASDPRLWSRPGQ